MRPRANREHLVYSLFETKRLRAIGEDVVDKDQCVTVLKSDSAMLSIQDPTMVLDASTGSSVGVRAVAFHPDGKHILGGSNGIRQWQLEDGQEVGTQMGKMGHYAISVSRDCKWIVCATQQGASVWDAEMRRKVIEVEGGNTVYTIDVCPDSTTFATGTRGEASVWDLVSGERQLYHCSQILPQRRAYCHCQL